MFSKFGRKLRKILVSRYNYFIQNFQNYKKHRETFLKVSSMFRKDYTKFHLFLCLSVRKIIQNFFEFLSKYFIICLYFFDNFPPFVLKFS